MVHIPVIGLDILDHDTVKALKKAAGEAGHQIVAAEKSAISQLWDEAKQKFPDLVADIQKGIKDVEDDSITGGEKAVKVAMDVMATAPDVLKALPDAKDFFVHAVTSVFADTKTALVAAAEKLIGEL